MAFDPARTPREVTIPIADLLGEDGHRFCTGWRLKPVDGSMNVARANREAWIAARAEGREAEVPEPRARPGPTFEGGIVAFLFKRNEVQERYEIATMFPRPVPW